MLVHLTLTFTLPPHVHTVAAPATFCKTVEVRDLPQVIAQALTESMQTGYVQTILEAGGCLTLTTQRHNPRPSAGVQRIDR